MATGLSQRGKTSCQLGNRPSTSRENMVARWLLINTSLARAATWISASPSVSAFSIVCIARVGTMVMPSPPECPPTDMAGPSILANRRPSVAMALILFSSNSSLMPPNA